MNQFLSNPQRLITLSFSFVVLGVVLAVVGLSKNSEVWGAIGMAMFAPAGLGFFRVLALPSRQGQTGDERND